MDPVIYTVISVEGDYAVLISEQGVENRVAMALLPFGIDTGNRLLFENFSYTVLDV